MGNLSEFLCFLCSSSTAQTSQPIQPAQSAEQVRADQSSTTQASRQEFAQASMSSSTYTARCVLKTNEGMEICPAYKTVQPFTKQLSWCDVTCTLLPLSPPFRIRTCMRRPGCFRRPWSSWQLEAPSLRLKLTTDLPVHFIHSHLVQFVLGARVAGGGTRPRK